MKTRQQTTALPTAPGIGPGPLWAWILTGLFLGLLITAQAGAAPAGPGGQWAQGHFAAGSVEGLKYQTAGGTDFTGEDGQFRYREGHWIRFSVGTIILGERVQALPLMTPMSLSPGSVDPTDLTVTNISRFLQSLDENQDPEDGILISEETHRRANGMHLDFHQPTGSFASEAQAILDDLFPLAPRTLVSEKAAQDHLRLALTGLVETVRDEKGTWTITGEHAPRYSVFEAMGYAVAQDRLWQSELFRRSARGRLSEIFGPTQIETDAVMRVIGYSDAELEAGFNALDEETKTVIKAYVDGFNRRIQDVRQNPDLLPFEFKAIGAAFGMVFFPEPWSVSDVLAWLAVFQRSFDPEGFNRYEQINNAALFGHLMARFPADAADMFEDLRWISDPDALTYIAEGPSDDKGPPLDRIPQHALDMKKAAKSMSRRFEKIRNNLEKINAFIRKGSYAWVISGDKTASGNPMIYSGPEMGFTVPSIILEGAIRAGGLDVSGMVLPGVPGVMIGRTPHHAWTAQVGHARSVDYYIEPPDAVRLHRMETIRVAGAADIRLPVFRTDHGPVIHPLPFDPTAYAASPDNPIISWKYSHWRYEFDTIEALIGFAKAESMDEFGNAAEKLGVSMHLGYADKDGNIAYWMTGRNPIRPPGEYRFPQGFLPGVPPAEWDAAHIRPLPTDRNPAKGFYAGWNNKSHPEGISSPNNLAFQFGPFHRAHVPDEYLARHENLTFEEVRDLALNIATTESFDTGGDPWQFVGGNPWQFVSEVFNAAIRSASTPDRMSALSLLADWDGHFVAGGPEMWAWGPDRADAWVLSEAWIKEVLRLTFADELGEELYQSHPVTPLFNALLHGMGQTAVVNRYDWFQNLSAPDAPQTLAEIISTALDNTLSRLGPRPWGDGLRGEVVYTHDLLGPVHMMPLSSRSTYGHCVEIGVSGPVRIESMFPLGQSGTILMDNSAGYPLFDPNFFSMTPLFDGFTHRAYPLFD